MRTFIFLLAFSVIVSPSQAADPKPKITYDQHVLPILKDKCLGCHNADKAKGGLDMTTYGKLIEGGASGEVVKPGDANGSRLFTLSSHKEEPKMPPDSPPLAKDRLDTISAWIAGGLLENAGSKAAAAKATENVSLMSIKRGRPDGPPPMPAAKLPLDATRSAQRPNAVVALAVSPWAPLVAVGSPTDVLLYHGETMQLIGTLPFKPGMPHSIKFSRNGSLLLVGGGRAGHSGKAVLYTVKTGEVVIEVGSENDCVLAADISADQTQIALGGPGKMIRIYSSKDGSLVREIKKHTDWINAVEFSPDGVLLATGDRSGGLFVWETANGREFLNLRGHTASVTDVSWRDDSNLLASTSEDGSLKLWEMENGKAIKSSSAHGGAEAVKYAHDNQLLTTGRDRAPKLWNANGDAVKSFKPMSDVGLRVGISHDNLIAYAGDWSGEVRAFRIADEAPVGSANTNPLPFAKRLAELEKAHAAKLAAATAAKAAVVTAQNGVIALQAEIATFQKNAVDSAETAKRLEAELPALKASGEKASAELPALQNAVKAAEVKAKLTAEMAFKFKGEADAAKGNAAMATAAAQAKQQADAAAAEHAAAGKLLEEKRAAANQIAAKVADAPKVVAQMKQTAQGLIQSLPAKQKALKPAGDAIVTALQQSQAPEAELKSLTASLEALKAQAKK